MHTWCQAQIIREESFLWTMIRLANPASIRSAVRDLAQDSGTQISLSYVYCMLDQQVNLPVGSASFRVREQTPCKSVIFL